MSFELVRDVKFKGSETVEDLIEIYRAIHGFTAESIARAVDVLTKCVEECDLRVLTFTANVVATGLRGILAQLLENELFNVVITTCGTVDHDIARSFGARYMKGSFDVDDRSLSEQGLHRLGNVFIPVSDYGPLIEKVVFNILDEVSKDHESIGVREILTEIGKRIDDENSILRAAALKNIPIYVPGFVDGAFGTALFMYTRFKPLKIDILKDEQELADIFFRAKKSCAFIIGGGISKHHALWWAQFHEGFSYAVYVTTAVEWDGSLSGARPREAITWGKLRSEARHVTVYGDATVVVPIIAFGLLRRTGKI